mgnify:CR=1 FL=1
MEPPLVGAQGGLAATRGLTVWAHQHAVRGQMLDPDVLLDVELLAAEVAAEQAIEHACSLLIHALLYIQG